MRSARGLDEIPFLIHEVGNNNSCQGKHQRVADFNQLGIDAVETEIGLDLEVSRYRSSTHRMPQDEAFSGAV